MCKKPPLIDSDRVALMNCFEPVVLIDNCLPHLKPCDSLECYSDKTLLCHHKIHKYARVFYLKDIGHIDERKYKDHQVIEHFFRLILEQGLDKKQSQMDWAVMDFIIITRDNDFFEDAEKIHKDIKLHPKPLPIIFKKEDKTVHYGEIVIQILNISNKPIIRNRKVTINVLVKRIHDFLWKRC